MPNHDWLAEHFESNRDRLRGVAYRLLGSLSDADDALQEAWLRVSRSETSVENPGGWLTTIVSRVCLDMLRSRDSRREHSLDDAVPIAASGRRSNPEHEAMLADAVGVALLVVLDALSPIERTVFVLHEMFAVPFDEIARIVGKSPTAARQIASRARRRVRGSVRGTSRSTLDQQRAVVDAFAAALRAGDLEALLRVLDPDVVVRIDAASSATRRASEARGAAAWATSAIGFARSLAGANSLRAVQAALIDGVPGLVLAPRGHLRRVLKFSVANDRIVSVDIIGDPDRLRELTLSVPTHSLETERQ